MAWLRVSHESFRLLVSRMLQPPATYECCVQRVHSTVSPSHYDVLGLQSDASNAEIKSAYYELSKKYHPDVATGISNAKERFTRLSTAYEVLSSPEKRAEYDRTLPGGDSSYTHITESDPVYKDFLRRRGTFNSRADPQAPFTRTPRSDFNNFYRRRYNDLYKQRYKDFYRQQYSDFYRQQYSGRTDRYPWETDKNYWNRMEQRRMSAVRVMQLFWLCFVFAVVIDITRGYDQ